MGNYSYEVKLYLSISLNYFLLFSADKGKINLQNASLYRHLNCFKVPKANFMRVIFKAKLTLKGKFVPAHSMKAYVGMKV
jgi:hypothetical protein